MLYNPCQTLITIYNDSEILIYDGSIMFNIKEYMKIKEAADFLGITCSTLRSWEKAGKIKVIRNPYNKYRLYKKSELEKILKTISESISS